MSGSRKTFMVPSGYEAERDDLGRATGWLVRKSDGRRVQVPELDGLREVVKPHRARAVRHLKRGTSYRVEQIAEFQCSTHKGLDGRRLVIYRGEYSDTGYARLLEEFDDGRFVPAPDDAVEPTPEGALADLVSKIERYGSKEPGGTAWTVRVPVVQLAAAKAELEALERPLNRARSDWLLEYEENKRLRSLLAWAATRMQPEDVATLAQMLEEEPRIVVDGDEEEAAERAKLDRALDRLTDQFLPDMQPDFEDSRAVQDWFVTTEAMVCELRGHLEPAPASLHAVREQRPKEKKPLPDRHYRPMYEQLALEAQDSKAQSPAPRDRSGVDDRTVPEF